jgi:phosphate transport system permease protein
MAFILYAPDGLDSDYTALPMQIFQWTSSPKRDFLTNAAAGIVVLMLTLFMLNSVAILLRNRYQRRQ